MKICVCVGSSCHLKGSYDIINLMKAALEKYGLTDTVDLSAAFCLGKCTHGVSIKVDDEIVTGLNRDNFDDILPARCWRSWEEAGMNKFLQLKNRTAKTATNASATAR
ncbi:MAG: (2Fe-2S) ferredoxin domain-containing protein [Ruthenibacterium lactatiformans]